MIPHYAKRLVQAVVRLERLVVAMIIPPSLVAAHRGPFVDFKIKILQLACQPVAMVGVPSVTKAVCHVRITLSAVRMAKIVIQILI